MREAAEYSRAGVDHNLEYRLIATEGRIVWIRDLVSVLSRRTANLALRAMVDVTEQKQMRKRCAKARRASTSRTRGWLSHWTIVTGVALAGTSALLLGHGGRLLRRPSCLPQHRASSRPSSSGRPRENAADFADILRNRAEEFTQEYDPAQRRFSAVVSEIGRRLLSDDASCNRVRHYPDITERKQTEDALRRAQMEAEIANRAKSQFLAT